MKIFYAGTTEHSARMLGALHSAGHEILGVLTREDAPVGRKKELISSPVAQKAQLLNLQLFKANVLSENLEDRIAALKPDLGYVLAYGTILDSRLLEIPKFGWINLHYSLLPSYRGAAPVQHAILNGESETGVTLFSLDSGVDTGPVIATAKHKLSGDENSGQALDSLTNLGIELTLKTLANFETEFAGKKSQSSEGVTLASKITRTDAKISFSRSAFDLHNLIRAMNPEPMAWFEYETSPVRVLKASVLDDSLPIGTATLNGNRVIVGCEKNALALEVVQPAGKSVMDAADWFRGLRQESVKLA